jgi:hypothetical protein
MGDLLLSEALCRATDEVTERIKEIYSDDAMMCKNGYKRFGDTELYIHGGGFSGLWAIGQIQIFQTMESVGAMKIHTLHGYSIGAIFAVFYACKFTTQESLAAYTMLRDRSDNLNLYSACRDVLTKFLPDDAHTLCTGRVRIGMTQKFPVMWYREESTFPTRNALIDAVVNSASIPYITASLSDTIHNYVDGLFGNTVWGWSPPRIGRIGIELLPPCVGYTYIFSPTDPYIYGLILNGLTDIIYFLQSKPTKYIRPLSYMPWHMGLVTRFVDKMHSNLLKRVT